MTVNSSKAFMIIKYWENEIKYKYILVEALNELEFHSDYAFKYYIHFYLTIK